MQPLVAFTACDIAYVTRCNYCEATGDIACATFVQLCEAFSTCDIACGTPYNFCEATCRATCDIACATFVQPSPCLTSHVKFIMLTKIEYVVALLVVTYFINLDAKFVDRSR